jgi:DNA-binding response OmpR family regulator
MMKTILIVEDDKLLGRTFCKYLDQAGYTVFWAENAQKAYEALSAQTVDLIFLDIMMPEIDGFAALETIKSQRAYEHIPIIMLSNLGGSEEMEKATSMGARDYIIKSNIDLNELVQKIQTEYLA